MTNNTDKAREAFEIPLTKGCTAIVDSSVYEELAQYKWRTSSMGYAVRAGFCEKEGKKKDIYMHHVVLPPLEGGIIDHINGNKTDNRLANLRHATQQQNCYNTQRDAGKHSKFRGVSWKQRNKKFYAAISANKKKHHLGYFDDETEAALAYNEAAVRLHGEFASLNIIESNK